MDCYTAEQLHGASLIGGYHDAAIEIDQDFIGLIRPGVRNQEMQAMKNVGPAMSAGDSGSEQLASHSRERGIAAAVYVLYLLGFFFFLPMVAGLIIAHVSIGTAGNFPASHYRYQIKTFWIGLSFVVLGVVLAVIGIAQDSIGEIGLYSLVIAGGLILAFWYFWTLFRCIKGLLLLARNQIPSTAGSLGNLQGAV